MLLTALVTLNGHNRWISYVQRGLSPVYLAPVKHVESCNHMFWIGIHLASFADTKPFSLMHQCAYGQVEAHEEAAHKPSTTQD
jgi:hypothetical protein